MLKFFMVKELYNRAIVKVPVLPFLKTLMIVKMNLTLIQMILLLQIILKNQVYNYYSSACKSVKWFRKVLFQCISIAQLNSFVLHNKCYAGHAMRTIKLEAFTKALASSLLQPKSEPEMFPRHQHELLKIQRKADNKIVRKRCHGCYEKIALESGRKQALAKTKQVDTECVSCKKPFCL